MFFYTTDYYNINIWHKLIEHFIPLKTKTKQT